MGYFDALTSAYFKTPQDGRKLFFPWGVLGRGYVIPSDHDYERLRTKIRTSTIVMLVLIVAASALQGFGVAFTVGAAIITCYALWVRSLLRGLKPSDETLSLDESMATQAHTHKAAHLWLLEIVSLAFVAGGIAILLIDPGQKFDALFTIGFFAVCAVVIARMLILRWRGAALGVSIVSVSAAGGRSSAPDSWPDGSLAVTAIGAAPSKMQGRDARGHLDPDRPDRAYSRRWPRLAAAKNH